jgi:hypothetical protein
LSSTLIGATGNIHYSQLKPQACQEFVFWIRKKGSGLLMRKRGKQSLVDNLVIAIKLEGIKTFLPTKKGAMF